MSYAHVDSVNVFRLLDEILSRERNNFVRGFERFDDISQWLRDQWAGLFADFISKRASETSIKDLASRVTELGQITSALKEYSELLIRQLQPEQSEEIIGQQERKIEEGRIESFAREDMIRFLLDSGMLGGVQASTAEALFRSFQASRSLEEFLTNAGFSREAIEGFMEAHGRPARRDCQIIAERYFGRLRGEEAVVPEPKSASASDMASQTTVPAPDASTTKGGRHKSKAIRSSR